jgi:putative ABC transport system substrate-binding protein
MRRREFITLLGGASAWPLAVSAQQGAKRPTIGFLGAASPAGWAKWTAAFVQRLGELGWIEGRTLAIEYRWAEGRKERFAEIAAEFVQLPVDIIVTSGPAVPAVKQATSVIPIVFPIENDPVGSGLVQSLARPGGNVTGLSLQFSDTVSKRFELLREVVPDLNRLAVIYNAGYAAVVIEMGEVRAVARRLGLELTALEIRRAEDIDPAFESLKGGGRTLCRKRPAREYPPESHQQLGARRAAPKHARLSGVRRSGRSDVLWGQFSGYVPARRRLSR